MGVASVRFNTKEEKLLKYLKEYYNCDASTLVKKSLWDLYEGIKDKEIVEIFEKKEKNGKSKFVKFENLK